VDVKNGVVRLTGTVDNQSDRITALTVTRSTHGVRGLVDDLEGRSTVDDFEIATPSAPDWRDSLRRKACWRAEEARDPPTVPSSLLLRAGER
jgi:hypothetical protein